MFDGKSLSGWEVMNGGKFKAEGGVIKLTGGGGWLRSTQEYDNFILRLEVRWLKAKQDSGIFLRASKEGKNWPDRRYEVQCENSPRIAHLFGAKHERNQELAVKSLKATGEWNTFEILCSGRRAEVKFNGVVVSTSEALNEPKGYIGLQGEGGLLEFRNLSIKKLLPTVPLASQPADVWVKRSPLPDGPVSPRLGYEGACVWDSRHRLLVRYGGHNQGGGGEQGAEVWTFDLLTAKWTLKEPNTSPPGVCCNAQNLYDPTTGRYLRFPLFSGSHGWQWSRELYLNDSSVWTYDLATNRWRNMRPLPTPRLAPYRAASWDSDQQVAVVFGGEGSREGTLVYDPWRNEWRWPKPADEPAPRSGGNMAYDAARKLHVLFGSQFTDDPHTWTYDLARNVWRDMQPDAIPPTRENDAVLTYDSLNRVVLALVKVTLGKGDDARHEVQTWAYDTGANRWTRRKPSAEPDAAGNRTRQLVFAPELNLAILENCTSKPREQQIWTYRYADAKPTPEAPQPKPRETPPIVEDAVVSVIGRKHVELSWTDPPGAKIAGYHVERAVVEVWSEDQLRRLKDRTPPLAEPSVGAIRRIGPFQRLTDRPRAATSFTDKQVDLGTPQPVEGEPIYQREFAAEQLDRGGRAYRFAVFAYRIRAVNEAGLASGPS
ncbi:MAG: DUF1080 domain-containing protein, partial [Gemmataceae bacterium]|nr:DUF1080 domain-containing protein [Gemmataceae bacterium]